MRLTDFQYDLPENAIAQSAIEPRHDSRLLDTRDMSDHRFLDVPHLLDTGDLVVVNETRVRAARLVGRRRDTGGRVELLLLDRGPGETWEALARPSRRLRPGVELDFEGMSAVIRSEPREGLVELELHADGDVEALIAASGSVPLPPYFRGELADDSRYQTMFANQPGSAAAPTAGLHFTDDVTSGLRSRGIEVAAVDLHVSLDTFRPISAERVEDHHMHAEWCAVSEATASKVEVAKSRGGRVVAVGTTVVRTLESFRDSAGGVVPGEKRTDLFIVPGHTFGVVDGLITNFHMPGSTLLVLLAAFMGESWRLAYETALGRGYRFLSFGDAMYADRSET